MTKTLRFRALALVASMGLCAALTSGCNPEEPAKPAAPAPTPNVTKPAPGGGKMEKTTPPATTTPTKEPDKKG